MFHKKFKFVKDFTYHGNVLKKGSDITVVRDIIYVNSGQIPPGYYQLFADIVNDELKNQTHELIREVPMIYNQI